jgi:YHS domain-containing protein
MPYEVEPIDETDPVCGMEADPHQAHDVGLEAEHAGHRYVFCSEACLEAFKADPARYAQVEEQGAI